MQGHHFPKKVQCGEKNVSIKKGTIFNTLMPVLPITAIPIDITTSSQNWHHLYSSSAAGKDLPNDTSELSMAYAQTCLEARVKNLEQNFLQLHWVLPAKNSPSR